jgi:hypothetical protein
VALEDTGFSVYAAADDLALRTDPFVTDVNLIKRVSAQARFYVKEPVDQAKGKVGLINQWLNVQDAVEGYVGYVAAWYVSLTPEPVAPEPAPAPTPAPTPAPAEGKLILYATTDGLALRTQPVLNDATLIKRLPLNAEFSVVEPEAQARAKIGLQGQWIRVRDIEGKQGYAAAWYLSDVRQNDVLGVTPAPPASTKLVVRTTTEGVALRSQPVISDVTLIKRVPLSSELLVLEPAAQAGAKVGVVNQWLMVRDSAGAEGYVAAWYVIQRPTPAAP